MRRTLIGLGIALALGAAATGCSRQSETLTSETTTDSLLATNPVEQPQGDLTPQEQYQSDQTPQAPVQSAPRSTPRRRSSSSNNNTSSNNNRATVVSPGVTLSAGTPLEVAVSTEISSKSAQVGDRWSGTVKDNVIVGNSVVIPAGSIVSGVVNVARPAESGSRAALGLAVTSVSVNGRDLNVAASTEPIEAGSPRARNLGAMAGGAAAGALIGKAVGGGGKGAVIGGLIGGAAAGAGVAKSKGYQVVLKEGTSITFAVDQNVTVKS